jgi:preprotein translocase subunit YajC
VFLTVLEFLWWLQPSESGGGGGGGSEGGGATDGMGCAMQIGLFGLMMVVFYFFLLRPEQKRRKEHEEMMKSLQKGTKVRTSGGILGEIVSVTDDEVVLQIADKVRVNVLRSHVSNVEAVRKAEAEKKDKKADEKKVEEAKRDEKKKDEPEKADEAQDGA